MKSRDTHVRLQRFHVEERRRRVAQIEAMINEFARMAAELDREIALEEQRAGISDLSHFAYPTYARAARARRDNLMRSSAELRGQLDDAKANLETALAELSKVQTLEGRDKGIDRGADGQEQGRTLDQLGLRAAQA
ncbi:MAG: flagellar export protein FliJ [Methylovirgula sp.]